MSPDDCERAAWHGRCFVQGKEVPMAAQGGTIADLRATVSRVRKEGERLMARVDRDVRTLARRSRAEIAADVRKLQKTLRSRADGSIRDIESRATRVIGSVEKQVTKTVEELLKHVHGAIHEELATLGRRVRDLEARVAVLEGLTEEDTSAM
jgi:uncharacterized coiled-coil protein SlyX